jgi:murein L,D-transpeptidase YcbB/YkuD
MSALKIIILVLISFCAFSQKIYTPFFRYKSFVPAIDTSATASNEVLEIRRRLSEEKDPWKKRQLTIAANNYQWLEGLKKKYKIILVNIPSATLQVFDHGKKQVTMKVVVGKKRTPTSTLLSTLNQLTVNPYWYVTRNIATREMLPRIIKNAGYLKRNSIRVLDSTHKVVDPASVNWSGLSRGNFPYTLRQNSGNANSLGSLKFQFNNPYFLYLHDTDSKHLFAKENRFFSHGCVRVEKPMELASLVLNTKQDLIKADIQKKKTKNIPLTSKEPYLVIFWYTIVDFDSSGTLKYFPDVYKRY